MDIPVDRYEQCLFIAKELGEEFVKKFPWYEKMKPVSKNALNCYLNRCWRPSLTVTGIEGLPSLEKAGNVLRPNTTVKLSIRLPPTKNGQEAADWVKKTLEENPP